MFATLARFAMIPGSRSESRLQAERRSSPSPPPPWLGIFGAILMGAGSGSEADVIPYMIAEYFGRKRFATLYGLSWTAYAIGGAVGPILMGHGFDRAGPMPRYQ